MGRLTIPFTLAVAPMLDWTDRHCRVFHRLLAPTARLYTEMRHAQAVIYGDRQRVLGFDPCEQPVALQLGGSDPKTLAHAAQIAEEWGYNEVNLNCGCPSDRVQAGQFGACLMRKPQQVSDCIAAMQAAVSIPITLKCRLGIDDEHDYFRFSQFVAQQIQAGAQTVIVHARNAWLKGLSPKENRHIPPLRYDWVYRLKQAHPTVPIWLNGGLDNMATVQAQRGLVDGVMLGRAAWHNPYLLHQLETVHTGRQPLQSRVDLLRALYPYVQTQLQRGVALKYLAKPWLGLFQGQPGARAFRKILSEGMHQAGADWKVVERALQATSS